jgi:hypothetical protein
MGILILVQNPSILNEKSGTVFAATVLADIRTN